jgi:hypothetical protein
MKQGEQKSRGKSVYADFNDLEKSSPHRVNFQNKEFPRV